MCPISGIVQCALILLTFILLFETVVVQALQVVFEPKNATLCMYNSVSANVTVTREAIDPPYMNISCATDDDHIASTSTKYIVLKQEAETFTDTFNITGTFLGKTKVRCKVNNFNTIQDEALDVTVIRQKRVIDSVFTASVITLVSVIYINFGCALKWDELRTNLKRPIGPIIGFLGQFLIMPVLSFTIGKILFPSNPEMQLGMFFTGVSPAGGASNIWTVMLDGNMDLSITMTTISTLAAFVMMPLWIFTLGKVIFDGAKLKVPYDHISYYAFCLIVPLGIGFLLSRYMKRVAKFLARILKGFSALLIIFIIVFAVVTNLYLFKLFSWQIVVAGMGLPYVGYVLGYILAKILKQPPRDCLAIAIETGIQNTGIAIFLLRLTLPNPEGDLTTVVPVAVAVMTPFPLLIMLLYKRLKQRLSPGHQKLDISKEPSAETNTFDVNLTTNKSDQLISTVS